MFIKKSNILFIYTNEAYSLIFQISRTDASLPLNNLNCFLVMWNQILVNIHSFSGPPDMAT